MSDLISPPPVPGTNVATGASGAPLATPWARLVAAIIDGIVLMPIYWILGMILIRTPSGEELLAAGLKGGADAVLDLAPSRWMYILSNLLSVAIFIGVSFVFLQRGQSIGKMLMKLQILDRSTGGLIPIQDLILKRVLPFWLAGAVLAAIHPALGLIVLVDALCIFRPQYNTLHDDLANSKVVQHPGSPIAALNPPGVPAV